MIYRKNDVLLLTDIFESYIFKYYSDFGINRLFSHSTPTSKWKAALIYARAEKPYLITAELRILHEKNVRSGPASVMGNRYILRSDTTKLQCCDFDNSPR